MFSKIKSVKEKLDHMYFGKQKVKNFGFVPRFDEKEQKIVESDDKCKIWVTYEDGGRESMTSEEWKLASQLPLKDEEMAQFDLNRLNSAILPAVLDAIQSKNIRLNDIPEMAKCVERSLDNYVSVAAESRYGSARFHDWTIEKVEEVTKHFSMEFSKMTGNPLGEKIWDFIVSDKTLTLESIHRAIIYINNSFNMYMDNAKSSSMGVMKQNARISDLMQAIREGEANSSNQDTNVTQNSESTGGQSVEPPASQDGTSSSPVAESSGSTTQ